MKYKKYISTGHELYGLVDEVSGEHRYLGPVPEGFPTGEPAVLVRVDQFIPIKVYPDFAFAAADDECKLCQQFSALVNCAVSTQFQLMWNAQEQDQFLENWDIHRESDNEGPHPCDEGEA